MTMGWEKRVVEIAQKGQPLHFLSSHSLLGIVGIIVPAGLVGKRPGGSADLELPP